MLGAATGLTNRVLVDVVDVLAGAELGALVVVERLGAGDEARDVKRVLLYRVRDDKLYDLGDGYCNYDFFAKCPHRLACARCPFYVPKDSTKGQLLAVRDGIEQMLEQLDLTDDEREALEGDRDAVAALAERLAETPTPAGPTPKELGTASAFIPLTSVLETLPSAKQGGTK